MKKSLLRVLALLLLSAMVLGMLGCGAETQEPTNAGVSETTGATEAQSNVNYDFTVSYEGIRKDSVSSGVSVHDPSILKVGDTYYIYGSHMASATSTDMLKWKKMSDGYGAQNPVFGQIYSVANEAFAYAGSGNSVIPTDDGGVHVWAPDVIYNKAMGKYVMYYCTTSTWCASNLCYGVSDSPEGPFEWKGALIYSGFTKDTIQHTNVLDVVDEDHVIENYYYGGKYNHDECPNAIDPSVFYDEDGRMWMVYGSWSGGIFLLELDEQTGEVIHPEADPENGVDPYFGKRLLGGGHKSIEGPYILRDPASGYYFLFVSYGALNRTGGYQIRVFRSETVDGDYVDMNGKTPFEGVNHAYYGLKMSGNYMVPSLHKAYMATGHNSALAEDGKLYVVHHTRFNGDSEMHSPRVRQFLLNEEGWPCMLPYQTQGETVSETGYSAEEVVGRYYMVNQGTAIDAEVAEPEMVYLNSDGTLKGAKIDGTWEMKDGTYYLTLNMGEKVYKGVFCAMLDEADTPVMAFSAVGYNETIYGVKYVETAE